MDGIKSETGINMVDQMMTLLLGQDKLHLYHSYCPPSTRAEVLPTTIGENTCVGVFRF